MTNLSQIYATPQGSSHLRMRAELFVEENELFDAPEDVSVGSIETELFHVAAPQAGPPPLPLLDRPESSDASGANKKRAPPFRTSLRPRASRCPRHLDEHLEPPALPSAYAREPPSYAARVPSSFGCAAECQSWYRAAAAIVGAHASPAAGDPPRRPPPPLGDHRGWHPALHLDRDTFAARNDETLRTRSHASPTPMMVRPRPFWGRKNLPPRNFESPENRPSPPGTEELGGCPHRFVPIRPGTDNLSDPSRDEPARGPGDCPEGDDAPSRRDQAERRSWSPRSREGRPAPETCSSRPLPPTPNGAPLPAPASPPFLMQEALGSAAPKTRRSWRPVDIDTAFPASPASAFAPPAAPRRSPSAARVPRVVVVVGGVGAGASGSSQPLAMQRR